MEVEKDLVVLLFAAAYNKIQSCCSGQDVMNRPCQSGSGEWIEREGSKQENLKWGGKGVSKGKYAER